MIAQALAEFPNECCGLLAGRLEETAGGERLGRVEASFALVNEAASPIEFLSEPRSMFEAIHAIDHQGYEILAVYHSHPNAPPIPSRRDLERNYSPQVVNLIISLASPRPEIRGWWLTESNSTPADWIIEDQAAAGSDAAQG